MTESLAKDNAEHNKLMSILLSTLDEKLFFCELGKSLHSLMNVDKTKIFLVNEDSSVRMVCLNGKTSKSSEMLEKGQGPAGHVIRTRKPYFSNNVSRDPLFHKEAAEGIMAELTIPVSVEGIVIATLHFQSESEETQFEREDITKILSILAEIKKPLTNMKMYLAAKHLNSSLVKQIELKEKELEERKGGLNIVGSYRIEEKEIICKSEVMKDVLRIADKVAISDIPTLIEGEEGVGREMIAKRIHCRSNRKDRAFVSIDCSALSEEQLEAEIFGSEVADFKGIQVKPGLIESANGGTLFINNISKLTLHLQSKLSLFLGEKMAFRLRGQMPFRSDVRIIAATNDDLGEKVSEGIFREDLFYCLNTMRLKVPALRERTDDIETLATYFLNLNRSKEEQKSLSPCVIKQLKEYVWPGNVRELQSIIERAYILSDGMIVEGDHLAECVTNFEEIVEEAEDEFINFREMTLDELEKRHICLSLDHLDGNKTKTARMLGITVKTLYNKLHSYGMIGQKEA